VNAVNFDVEIFKPGCGGIPSFDYIAKLRLTLALMAISAFLFCLGCLLRLCLNLRREMRMQAGSVMDVELIDDDHEEEHSRNHAAKPPMERVHSLKTANGTEVSPSQPAQFLKAVKLTAAYVDFKQRTYHGT
jgi:hypothetical protein